MAAVMNGVALHGGFIPYGGTFLTFSDYSRNAIRMAALMKRARDPRLHARLDRPRRGRPDAPERRARRQPAPDPQPRRLAPGRHRRDGGRLGLRDRAHDRPSALLLSRQNLPYCPKAEPRRHRARRLRAGRAGRGRPEEEGAGGDPGHRLARCSWRCTRRPQLAERRHRGARGVDAAAPRCSTARDVAYKAQRAAARLPRIAVEAGVTDGWWKYGCAAVVGIDRYGESGARRRAVQALRLHGRERRRHRCARC